MNQRTATASPRDYGSLRNLLVAVTLANALYVRVWAELFTATGGPATYGVMTSATPTHFFALMSNVLLLGLILWLIVTWLRAHQLLAYKLIPFAFLVYSLILLNSLRPLSDFVDGHAVAFASTLMVGAIVAFVFGGARTYRVAYWSILIFSPFVAITFAQGFFYSISHDPSKMSVGHLAERVSSAPVAPRRVIWVVFDGWDAPLTFEDRPAGVALPEIDRIRQESFYAPNAVTAEYSTDKSMPSLVSGLFVNDSMQAGPSELKIRNRDSNEWLLWSQQPNVFGEVRAAGFDAAVAAWAIPYCRVFRSLLTDCEWWSSSNRYNSVGTTFSEILVNQSRSLFETKYRSPFGASLKTHRHLWVYEQVLAKSIELVVDQSYGLILLHLPIPHSPYFYNAATESNDFRSQPFSGTLLVSSAKGYLSALVLVDKTIVKLRQEMERAGVWDETTVIMTSDHPWRFRKSLDGGAVSRTVPYLVKMPGEPVPLRYETAFSVVLTKQLILAVLNGELSDSHEIAHWIDEHRTEYPFE